LLEQTQSVRKQIEALRSAGLPITPESIAERFTRTPRGRVKEILKALETLGFA